MPHARVPRLGRTRCLEKLQEGHNNTSLDLYTIHRRLVENLAEEVKEDEIGVMKKGEFPNWQKRTLCPMMAVAVADAVPANRCGKAEDGRIGHYGEVEGGWECRHNLDDQANRSGCCGVQVVGDKKSVWCTVRIARDPEQAAKVTVSTNGRVGANPSEACCALLMLASADYHNSIGICLPHPA